MMINSVNNVNFRGWKQDIKMLFPKKLVGYSKHTPKEHNIPYGYYMSKSQTQNPIKTFIKEMFESIRKAKKPDPNIKESATGMTFEA